MTTQWGKDRPPTGQFDNVPPQQAAAAAAAAPPFNNGPGFFPQYGGPANPMNQGNGIRSI